jgi:hypothetical protein
LIVQVNQPEVQVSAPSMLLLRSAEGQRQADLVAALTAPEATRTGQPLAGTLVPIGFRDGKYEALLQMHLPSSGTLDAVWDLGFSILWRDAVRNSDQRRISVAGSADPVVVEQELDVALSPFEVMMVAQEQSTDDVVTGHLTDRWPDPRGAPLSIGPIRAAQPFDAHFVRGDETRWHGMLGLAELEPIHSGRGVTILTLVCRDPCSRAARLRVVHRMTGAIGLKLQPTELDLAKGQRCGLVRATIPEWNLCPGTLEYAISVTDGKRRSAASARRFLVIDGL